MAYLVGIRMHVAKQNDGCWLVFKYSLDDVSEMAVWVATKKVHN